jgi:hemerythrin
MSLITWSEEISVGVSALDDEHKRVVEMLNDLYDALREDKGQEVIGDILASLEAYAAMHFKHEEDLFKETAFPHIDEHIKEHQSAMSRIHDFQTKLREGVSLELCHELFQFLTNWFLDHVMGTDRQYTAHLNARGIR